MCDERDRLIGYVYGEVDATERRAVEGHLEECPDCRAEIAGLEATRQDLLAWDVPKHEPIWRPLPPVVSRPVWQQVPAWALAAAAGVVLAAGVGGGFVAQLMMPAAAPVTAVIPAAPAVPAATPISAAPSAEVVAAIEARVLERVRREMQQEFVAFRAAAVGTARSAVDARSAGGARDTAFDGFNRRLAELEEWRDDQIGLNAVFDNRLGGISSRTRSLDNEFSLLRQVAFASGGGR